MTGEFSTQFGMLKYNLSVYKEVVGVIITGEVKINGVEYRVNHQLKKVDLFNTSHLSMDRLDRKDAAYPYKAREKFEIECRVSWNMFVNHDMIVQVQEEYRQEKIQELADEIQKLEKEIQEKRILLNQLLSA